MQARLPSGSLTGNLYSQRESSTEDGWKDYTAGKDGTGMEGRLKWIGGQVLGIGRRMGEQGGERRG